jgi:hypothetical protein
MAAGARAVNKVAKRIRRGLGRMGEPLEIKFVES